MATQVKEQLKGAVLCEIEWKSPDTDPEYLVSAEDKEKDRLANGWRARCARQQCWRAHTSCLS